MNERIRELWHKSGGDYMDSNQLSSYYYINDPEKFAELIVEECYETIKKDMELAHIQLIPINFRIYANGRLRRIIEEHFGV